MGNKYNLQDKVINILRTGKIKATVYLVNGFQVEGIIRSFDDYTILIEDKSHQNLIYKHAISTIVPSEYIQLVGKQNNTEEEKETEIKEKEIKEEE